MLPEVLEGVDQRVLQLVEGRENAIGEGLAQMAEDLLGRVELGTVTWQIEGMHASWPAHLATVMTARTIQHDPNGPLSQSVPQMRAPKSCKHWLSTLGSSRKTPVPVVGSAAA
jgi:hypothetical protein